MLKRLIAIICIFVLIFALAMPCYAETQPDYVDHINLEYSYSDDLSGIVISFRGDIKVSFNEDCFYFKDLIFVCSPFGFQGLSIDSDGYYSRVIEADPFDAIYVFDSSLINQSVYDLNSMSVYYFEEDVVYASSNCRTFGFSFVVTEGGSGGGFTQEDLDDAREEGYDEGYREGLTEAEDSYSEGFIDGKESIDQDAIRQEGYDEGFTAGAESIDQDAIRQEGYDDGFTEGQDSINRDEIFQAGYDDGFTKGQDSIDRDAIRQEGYTDGFLVGRDEGYEGALKDLEKRKSAYFEHCTFEAIVRGITADTGAPFAHRISFTPSFTSFATVSFDTLYVEIKNYVNSFGASWDYVNSVEILMIWDDANVCDFSILPLYAISDYGFSSGAVYTPRGSVYNLKLSDADSEGKRKFELIDYAYGVTVKQINVKFDYLPEDALLNFRFFVPDQFYNNGYVDGYSDGFIKGADSDSSSSFNEGYENGYTTGYLVGKDEGLSLVQQGDWKQLILAVVEAPINTFQSLFNFEVLGLDMRVAFGSILSVCVILIIVKKVIL